MKDSAYDMEELDEAPPAQVSAADIYQQLILSNSTILTIPVSEETKLRQGLANAKSKYNKKLEAEGFPVDKSILNFVQLPCTVPDAIRLQITLVQRSGIKVLSIETPGEL